MSDKDKDKDKDKANEKKAAFLCKYIRIEEKLDELVIDVCSAKASEVNNHGVVSQIAFLLGEGYNEGAILREALGESKAVRAMYSKGECPDCKTPIPKNVVEGQACKNCGHVFFLIRDTDDGSQRRFFPIPLDFLPNTCEDTNMKSIIKKLGKKEAKRITGNTLDLAETEARSQLDHITNDDEDVRAKNNLDDVLHAKHIMKELWKAYKFWKAGVIYRKNPSKMVPML